ncbi:MAG: sporulation stage IV protein A, partial [Lachnospiraceae bacterium]
IIRLCGTFLMIDVSNTREESQVKLQDTMKKIVNDSKGGMVCIII